MSLGGEFVRHCWPVLDKASSGTLIGGSFSVMPDASTPFPNTRWTLLQRLRDGTEEDARAALDILCRAYWMPLYAVARMRSMTEHDAQDAVQGFFESLLRADTFLRASKAQGKLRSLLLNAFENYCISEWRKATRAKRGAGAEHVPIFDTESAERRLALDIAAKDLPVETLYNREWARSVLERSLEALRADYAARGLAARFEVMAGPLMEDDDSESLVALAEQCGMEPGAFRVALHRLRVQYRARIEQELSATLNSADPAAIQEEKMDLFRAFD